MSECSNSVNKYVIVQTPPEQGVLTGLTVSGDVTICGTGSTLSVRTITGCTTDGVNINGNTFQNNGDVDYISILTVPVINTTTLSGGTLYGDGSNLIGITDSYATSGTYSTGFITITGTGDFSSFNIDVSGLLDDTNSYLTGATLNTSNSLLSLTLNNQPQVDVDLSPLVFTGGTDNCITDFYVHNIHGCSPITLVDDVIISGNTTIGGNLTIVNEPTTDNELIQILGRDASTGEMKYRNVNTIISTATSTDTYVTGATLNVNSLEINRNGGLPSLSVDLSHFLDNTDNFVTGATYSNNTLTLNRTNGSLNVEIPSEYVSGVTFNPTTYDLTLSRTNGLSNLTSNLAALASDIYVLSGVYNPSTGIVTYTNNSGATFSVSGFTTGMTDSYTTDAYLDGNEIRFDNNIQGGNIYNVDLTPLLSGKTNNTDFWLHTGDTNNPHQTSFSNLTSTGHTHTISEITDFVNYFVTGGTVTGSDLVLGRNDGDIVTIDTSNYFDSKWTQSGSSIYNLTNNVGIGTNNPQFTLDVVGSGGTNSFDDIGRFRTIDSTDYLAITNAISTDGSFNPVLRSFNNTNVSTNFYIQSVIDPSVDTGVNPLLMLQGRVSTDPGNATWSGVTTRPILRVRNNSSNLIEVTSDGNLGVNNTNPTEKLDVGGNAIISGSVTATTYYGDGSNLTGISTQDTFVTGATYSNNNFIFTDNNGGSFSVSLNIMTGLTVNGVFSATTLYGDGSNLTGISGGDNYYVSGGTYSGGNLFFSGNSVNTTFTVDVSDLLGGTNSYVTGGTVSGTDLILGRNGGLSNVTIDTSSYFDNTNYYVTGGTYSNGTAVFTNNNGGSFSVDGFLTGSTSAGGDYLPLSGGTVTGDVIINGQTILSNTGQNTLTIVGSGGTEPLLLITGSTGELFSVSDTNDGSLYQINDASANTIFEVYSDTRIVMGSYNAPSLYATTGVTVNSGTTSVYSFNTSGYTGVFVDYTLMNTLGARAGNMMGIFSGDSIQYTETSTNDIGDTSSISLSMLVTGGTTSINTISSTNSWAVKTIIRSI